MMIGILSDTHGDVRRTARAIEAISRYSPSHVIHCGDIGSEAVLTELAAGFAAPETPVTCVLGNVDLYARGLQSGWPHVRIEGRSARLNLGGKSVAVIHGDDSKALDNAIQGQAFDYILTGHSHVRSDEREGRTRIINPGALHRSSAPSCAILDLEQDRLQFLEIS